MTQKRIIADNLLSLEQNNIQKDPNLFCTSAIPTTNHKSDHNIIDFGKWFFFCQYCRHGGHANCIDEWFGDNIDEESIKIQNGIINLDITSSQHSFKSKSRQVCGVNSCLCKCKSKI